MNEGRGMDDELHCHAGACEKDDLAILIDDDFFVLMKYNKMGPHRHRQGDRGHPIPEKDQKRREVHNNLTSNVRPKGEPLRRRSRASLGCWSNNLLSAMR
jgi:hypothetical protein